MHAVAKRVTAATMQGSTRRAWGSTFACAARLLKHAPSPPNTTHRWIKHKGRGVVRGKLISVAACGHDLSTPLRPCATGPGGARGARALPSPEPHFQARW